jgi:uncharacterized protein
MKCPNDETTLVMTDRSGIEIDYCPQCRGVWLDRGELDKLIERSAQPYAAAPAPAAAGPQPQTSRPVPGQEYFDDRETRARSEGPNYRDSQTGYYDKDGKHDNYYGYQKKHKKESFLGDLFDF